MLDALPLADEAGARDRAAFVIKAADPFALGQLLAQRLQPFDGLRFQPAIGQFLNPIGEPAFQEPAIVGWRLLVEEIAPLLLQIRRRHRLQCRQPCQHPVAHRPFSVCGFA